MLMSADKVGGWVRKGQKHADVILERPLNEKKTDLFNKCLDCSLLEMIMNYF